tara:strand:- start:348 stop:953 length:606 start_codon:yes stop_codon:yes gene_type:complete
VKKKPIKTHIEYTILNKSKPCTIILVHGLYASSGFWLEYLKLFKNYRLFILNIDYDHYLSEDCPFDQLQSDLLNLPYPNDNSIIISHSLGTIIANFLSQNLDLISSEICPIHISERINPKKFIDDINKLMDKSKISVNKKLTLVDNFLLSFKPIFDSKISLYIPNNDQYFKYNKSFLNSNCFSGDHYDIKEALITILNKIK